MAKKTKKRDLGKGLGGLLSGISADFDQQKVAGNQEKLAVGVKAIAALIPVEQVEVNPWQPRNQFEEEALSELSKSIEIHGIIQPITVRRLNDRAYQLISGERRLRASKLAGLTEVPAYIRVANDQEMLEMALVENIQRADLNAIEVAFTYLRLKEECKLTDEQVADRVAKKRTTVTNILRLTKLPPDIQNAIKAGRISGGHGKTLAGVDNLLAQMDIFKKVLEHKLSVRATEALVASYENPKKKARKDSGLENTAMAPEIREIQDSISDFFQKKVNLKRKSSGKGQIVINFASDAELNDILEKLEGDSFQ